MDFTFNSIWKIFTDNFSQYLDYFFYLWKNPSLKNPFYIILAIYFITFMLEVILPKKENYPLLKRKGFKTDLLYLVFIDFAFAAIGFYAITSVVENFFLAGMAKAGFSLPLFDVNTLPVILQILLFLVLVDLVQFIAHYLLHRIGFLWEFHKIHHAQEQLGFASTRHFHWMEYVVFKPLLFIPFSILGYAAKDYVVYYMWFGYFFVFLSHCNIKVNWGIFKYIVINPETHYWHHAQNSPGRFGVNFASVFNFWDILFKTFYLPEDQKIKPKLGVEEQKDIPVDFLGQMIHPFKSLLLQGKQKKNKPRPEPGYLVVESKHSPSTKPREWKRKK